MILFNLCGHGHFDMQAYDDYLNGRLQDHAMPEDERDRALAAIANFPPAPAPPSAVAARPGPDPDRAACAGRSVLRCPA